MAGVSQDMLFEYIQRKGGRVKNVDLVRHFRKHLLCDDPSKKDQAREAFKETVNSIAYIRQEEGEKFLYLKDEYKILSKNSSPSRQSHDVAVPLTKHSNYQSENSPMKTCLPVAYNTSVPMTSAPVAYNTSVPMAYNTSVPMTSAPVAYNTSVPMAYNTSVPMTSAPVAYNTSVPMTHNTNVHNTSVPMTSAPVAYNTSVPMTHNTNVHNTSVPMTSAPVAYNTSVPMTSVPVAYNTSVTHNTSVPVTHNTSVPVAYNTSVTHNTSVPMTSVPTRLQNGGGTSYDLEPEQKSVSPKHFYKKPSDVGSTSRSTQNRFFPSKSNSPSHQTKVSSSPHNSPVLQRTSQPPPPLSTSFPTSSYSDYFQHGGHNHSPVHQSGGKGNKKMSLEISSPISVHSLSNGTAMAESSDLQQVMADLENFGKTGIFNDQYSVYHTSSHVTTESSLLSYPPPHAHSSENSSLSSNSMQSTSSPPSEQNLMSPPVVKVSHSSSRGSQRVQALIQQYTVPPGSVPSLSPGIDKSSGQRLTSPTSIHSTNSDLQLRREPTPPDIKVHRSHSSAGTVIRRSKGLDVRNSNLGTLTRESIRASNSHKLAHRLSKNSDELVMSNSKEELLSEEQDRESPIDEYILEIDPLEKDWMAALINGNIDSLHHMIMSDNSYVNKRGFLHGWTALHWAAKLGHPHLIEAIMFSGAKVDIRSGSTPLHLAAEAGHYNIVQMLVNEYNAPVTARDYCGLRPVDVVNTWAPNNIRSVLRRGLPHRGLPSVNATLAVPTGVVPRNARLPSSKQWGSVGQLSDREVAEKKSASSKGGVKKGISFRRKKKSYEVKKKDKDKRNSTISEYYDNYDEP